MTIKLRFDANPEWAGSRVWTEEPSLAPVAGLLDFDLQTAASARRWLQKLKDVVSGKMAPFEGVGNGYRCAISPSHSEVSLNMDDDPGTVTVATTDLAGAVEEWAEYLEGL